MMRVVAGSARGKKLLVVPGHGTRPILDRVKTSLFDVLRPRLPGMTMLDLFAGSGSVGIEALSQGAEHCTFLDLAPRAVATIRKNLEITGFSDRAEVRQANALAYLKATDRSFDLICVAPPQYKDLWVAAMQQIDGRPGLLKGTGTDGGSAEDRGSGLVIAQVDPREYRSLDLAALRETRQNRYGNTLLVFYEYEPGGDADPGSVSVIVPGD